jgi:glutathione S-transferase
LDGHARQPSLLANVPDATLYRCNTRSNWLCPCGRVARRLRRDGIDAEHVRVPWRRRDRDELRELTGQTTVPVLVVSGEAICDSKRIVEHLEYLHGSSTSA